MTQPNPKADFYFAKAGKWTACVKRLRRIALGCDLEEMVKWGVPCYTLDGANVVLMHTFNEYCALLFMKGSLLDDPAQLLVQQTKNVQGARQIRFRNEEEIATLTPVLTVYIKNATAVERSGKKVELKPTEAFEMVEEFRKTLEEMPDVAEAFRSLTPGRQRGYLLHFAQPKLAKTRESRIEKAIPMILDGKGLND